MNNQQPHDGYKVWDEIYTSSTDWPWVHISLPDKILADFLSHIPRGGTILDYGCGLGQYCSYFADQCYDVVATDISAQALDVVAKRCDGKQVKTLCVHHPKQIEGYGGGFDGIWVRGVMHHVQRSYRDEYIQSFFRLLRPHGVLLLAGHSMKDKAFEKGWRISPTTQEVSYAVDYLIPLLKNYPHYEIIEGYYPFVEHPGGAQRWFRYVLCFG